MSAAATRRRTSTALLAVALLLGTGACSAVEPAEAPAVAVPTRTPAAAEPSPTAAPAPTLPDVPVTGTRLADTAAGSPAQAPPVSLAVPALDVTLPIDPVGVQDDGQMEIPPLAERGGWYRFGAAPGAATGTAVIAAHVDSVASAGLGPFARLVDVAPGDVVTVTDDAGAEHRYEVTEVRTEPKTAVTWPDVFVREGAHRLVLITCGGTFQREASSYSDNVIVTAVPAGA